MTAVRQFSTIYDIVGRNCQDESTNGDTLAKEAVVQVVQELSRENKIPWQLQGRDGEITLSLTTKTGPLSIIPAQTDIQHISRIYFTLNGIVTDLERIESEEEWLRRTDRFSTGYSIVYRDFEMGSSVTTREIIVWPGPAASFISLATNLKMIYYSPIPLPSADGDIIRLPSEHEPILINGGTFHMAMKQGDSVMMSIFGALYEKDKQKFRAALTYERYDQDVVSVPANPYGAYGKFGLEGTRDYGRRYGP